MCIAARPGELVHSLPNHPGTIYLIKNGLLKTRQIDPSGRLYNVRFPRQGEIIGWELFAETEIFSETIAITETSVIAMPFAVLQEQIRFNESLATTLYEIFGRYLKTENDRILTYSRQSAPGKVANFLLAESKEHNHKNGRNIFKLQMTHGDIASYLGIRLETLSRIISAFVSAGHIKRTKKIFEIIDHNALAISLDSTYSNTV